MLVHVSLWFHVLQFYDRVPSELVILIPKDGKKDVEAKVFMVVGDSDAALNTNIYTLADEIIQAHLASLRLMFNHH